MNTFPLQSISIEEAKKLQFKAVEAATHHFTGEEVLSMGDLGVVPGHGKPVTTEKVERVFAEVFDAESALLVQGSGTGAIRWGLLGMMAPNDTLLVHTAPVYPTTEVTLNSMALSTVSVDFNDEKALKSVLSDPAISLDGALVQHTRQAPSDSYDFAKVIQWMKELRPEMPIITDDNYAALKVRAIGNQAGADLATFSCFKILGPEGVGVILGKKSYVEKIRSFQYSGGSQIQGFLAMKALQGLIYAPVALAIQSEVNEELVVRLKNGEVSGVKNAFLANAQSKVLLVELDEPVAKKLLTITPKYGAASHPVGSESIYEFAPMMYRISGTFRADDPTLEERMIRINPMRSGADTIIQILKKSLAEIH